MKRFHEHPWVPRSEVVEDILGGECENWDFYANNLKKKVFSDDYGWTSWTTKYNILEMSARYDEPISQAQQCEVWYQQECANGNEGWVARCTTAPELCGDSKSKYAGSESFVRECAKAQREHPDWPILQMLNDGRAFWDIEPLKELGDCGGLAHGELENVGDQDEQQAQHHEAERNVDLHLFGF